MLARVPWSPVLKAKAKPKTKRLTRERKRSIREKIVAMIKAGMEAGQPSLFWCEGPARHGVRSSLCLQGWRWAEADTAAQEIVAAALNIVGAKRPTWYEGQPEYTQPGALPIERVRCIRCRKPLPENHYKFCSRVCATGWHHDRHNAARAADALAAATARESAWKAKA